MNESTPDFAFAEGKLILEVMAERLPVEIDARQAITEMRDGGSSHWRQMEWIGFFPEYWFAEYLQTELATTSGPRFGNMTFDIKRKFVWDLKAHSNNSGGSRSWAPLNDVDAIVDCINQHDGVGFLVLSGPCTYDTNGEFKKWHDCLKGRESTYVKKNAERGAPSRRRKISFQPNHLICFRFNTVDDVGRSQREGWIKGFQTGMRNSNGVPRRTKLQVDLKAIPEWALIGEIHR